MGQKLTVSPYLPKNKEEWRGGFGKVWKVINKKTNKTYALKEMKKVKVIDKKSETSILYERELLCKLNSPFIVNMHLCFQDHDNLYLLMDFLSGGDLRYHICKYRKFTEKQSKFFISNIILGLEYIHSKKIIHRDIKPENLVLDENGYVRITDFGIAKFFNKDKDNKNETSGTPGYMSPEVIRCMNHGYPVDYFAIGIIGYELMIGKRPYNGKSRKEIKEQMMAKQAKITLENIKANGWSLDAADFINKLIIRKPDLRLGHKGIKELKTHKWFTKYPWQLVNSKKYQSPFIPESKDNFDKKYCEAPDRVGLETEERYEGFKQNPTFRKMFINFTYIKHEEDVVGYDRMMNINEELGGLSVTEIPCDYKVLYKKQEDNNKSQSRSRSRCINNVDDNVDNTNEDIEGFDEINLDDTVGEQTLTIVKDTNNDSRNKKKTKTMLADLSSMNSISYKNIFKDKTKKTFKLKKNNEVPTLRINISDNCEDNMTIKKHKKCPSINDNSVLLHKILNIGFTKPNIKKPVKRPNSIKTITHLDAKDRLSITISNIKSPKPKTKLNLSKGNTINPRDCSHSNKIKKVKPAYIKISGNDILKEPNSNKTKRRNQSSSGNDTNFVMNTIERTEGIPRCKSNFHLKIITNHYTKNNIPRVENTETLTISKECKSPKIEPKMSQKKMDMTHKTHTKTISGNITSKVKESAKSILFNKNFSPLDFKKICSNLKGIKTSHNHNKSSNQNNPTSSNTNCNSNSNTIFIGGKKGGSSSHSTVSTSSVHNVKKE